MIPIAIDHFETWRAAARRLLREGVPPQSIRWRQPRHGQLALEFEEEAAATEPSGATPAADGPAAVQVSKTFLTLAQTVACHHDPAKWEQLYRVLWRMAHGERTLLDRAGDGDVARLLDMEREVRRDSQRMKAFLRFHRLGPPESQTLVAWHRPEHDILRRVAPFFVHRFPRQAWAILTPRESVSYDRTELHYGPGVDVAAPPRKEELERLWQAYALAVLHPAPADAPPPESEPPAVRSWASLPGDGPILDALLTDAQQQVHDAIRRQKRPAVSAEDFLPVRRDLATLARAAKSCQGCPLYQRGTQTVFGEGLPDADLVFVGEQPGDQEDRQGHPFVGRAGRFLEEALQQAGIDRSRVYLTNAVKHFKWEGPAHRRTPKRPDQREQAACRPWLEAELAALTPKVIVCLGATAAQVLLGREFRITRQRGEVFHTDHAPCTLATHHPSAILRLDDGPVRDQMRQEFLTDIHRAAAQLRTLHATTESPRVPTATP